MATFTRYFLLFLLLSFCFHAQSQPYNNEWIDYNKTYYSFKVGPFGYDVVSAPIKSGIVHITQATLASAGLAGISSEHFQLWRDGAEIPLYISKISGILSTGDYIEFYGEIANGKTDKELYADDSYRLSDKWNLFTDSATYYLAVNVSGNNKRIVDAVNDLSGSLPQADKNFYYTAGRYYRAAISQGIGLYAEQKLYLSSYDRNEGWVSRPVRKNFSPLGSAQLPQFFNKLHLDTLSQKMTAKLILAGNAPNERQAKIFLNNDSLMQFEINDFLQKRIIINDIPANTIKNDTAAFLIQNLAAEDDDELRVASIELTYPRFFDFDSRNYFEFSLQPSPQGRYIEIKNFDKGNTLPVLTDKLNNKRFFADTSLQGIVRFFLPASSFGYDLQLRKDDLATVKNINQLEEKKFVDYSLAENQGDYLIITNSLLQQGSIDYVKEYGKYRSSDSGGHYKVYIINVPELVDQFAYGVKMSPVGIKNFLRFANDKFSLKPQYVFLIGKGVSYPAYRFNSTNPYTDQINLVPVFGYPGSDNLLSASNYSDIAQTPIGRLSAVSPTEIKAYLEKVKQYEAALADTSLSINDKNFTKKVLQIAGANDAAVSIKIDTFMQHYTSIISDTLFGGQVSTFSKTISPAEYPKALDSFTRAYNNGAALIQYFGHSSSTSIDFNLDNPVNYTNTGRYPSFIVNGCLAGNIFDYEPNRLADRTTLSEKFVLEPGKGAISYISGSSFGVLDYLDVFTEKIYRSAAYGSYNKGIGNIMKQALDDALHYYGVNEFHGRMHAQQYTLHGDPAIRLSNADLPDYATDSQHIYISPSILSTALDSINITIECFNLGRATIDSVPVAVYRTYPGGKKEKVFGKLLSPLHNHTSIKIKLPVVANRDKGKNILSVSIDENHLLPELNESNNLAKTSFIISSEGALPVVPYKYAIIPFDTVSLYASILNKSDSAEEFMLELDTTVLFNSPLKYTSSLKANAGLLIFNNISLPLNNTVYYWKVSTANSIVPTQNIFSFLQNDTAVSGFEQSHFYQHLESGFNHLFLDSQTRKFYFNKAVNNLFIQHSIYPTSGIEDAQFSITQNGTIITWSACIGHSVIFNLFDPDTGKPVLNTTNPYGAASVCDSMRRYNFEFSTQTPQARKNAMDFMDDYIQNGYYVVVRKNYDKGDADWAPTVWAKDTLLYGHNNSLYHRLKNQGIITDSFIYPRAFIGVFKKNDSLTYKPQTVFSKGVYDRINYSANIIITETLAALRSPWFGPGNNWHTAIWNADASNANDHSFIEIHAKDTTGKDSLFYTLPASQKQQDISGINAKDFPYISLQLNTSDTISYQPYQLNNWSVQSTPIPEGAVDLNADYSLPDTLRFFHPENSFFDTMKGYIVFKNISAAAFAPLKIKLVMYDANDSAHIFSLPYTKSLVGGDSLHIDFLIDVRALPQGLYNLLIEVNPDNDQPEQYHFNNKLYHYIFIQREFVLSSFLISFTAEKQNNAVLLKWSAGDEKNIAYYEMQHSATGSSFNSFAQIKTSQSNSFKSYSQIHLQPVYGNNFYRLKIIYTDGSISYSKILQAYFDQQFVIIYPNPVHNKLHITATGNQPYHAELFNTTGQPLVKTNFSSSTIINLSHLPAGMYLLKVTGNKQSQAFRISKMN